MKYKHNRLYCFSPPVMIVTFVVEIALLIYVLARDRSRLVSRIIAIQLFCLGLFQFAEFNVCGRTGSRAAMWSSIGFVAITMLPPLGVHLVQAIAGRGSNRTIWAAYTTGLIWAVLLVQMNAFSGHACAGNYAIFQLGNNYGGLYFAYYYFWLFIGMAMAMNFAFDAKTPIRKALMWQVIGYLSFLLPTAITNTVRPSTIAGLPSIMCGFAVVYALILSYKIFPLIATQKSQKSPVRKS